LGCKNVGVVRRDGLLGQASDPIAAATWFEKACNQRLGEACRHRGNLYKSEGKPGCGTPRLAWLDKAIAAGDTMAYNERGFYHDNCPDGDKAIARESFRQACEAGSNTGCYNTGLVNLYGRGGDVDLAAAADAFETACKAAEPDACTKRILVAEKQQEDVVPWYAFACGHGAIDWCLDYTVALINAGDASRGPTAIFASQKACDAKNAIGCRNLGVLHNKGLLGIPKSRENARPYFQQACDLGDKPACGEL